MYQVFQDGIPADSTGYPNIRGACWTTSIFDDYQKAVEYAHLWAYPISQDDLDGMPLRHMPLGVPVDMSMGNDCKVMMEVREISQKGMD